MPSAGTHLDKLTRAVLQYSDYADCLVNEMSHDQLVWRPSPSRWSVAEWFEHLVVLGEDFRARVREPLLAAWHDPSFEDAPYRRTVAGRIAVLEARFWASRSRGRGQVIPPATTATAPTRFLEQQSDLLELFDEAREVDLGGIRLGSPVGRLIGLNLGDLFELLVVHQQHALAQAERVVETPGFPGAQRLSRHTPAVMLPDVLRTA
jgi:DinB superfamily